MTRAFLTSHVAVAIYAIYAVLILATLIVWIVSRASYPPPSGEVSPGGRRRGPGGASELVARVKSWWWMISIFAFAILTYQWVATVLLAFISFLALKEYFSLIPQRRDDRMILFWAYLAIPVQYAFAYYGRFGLYMTFIPIWMFLFLPARMTIEGRTANFLRAVGTLSWGLMIAVFCLGHTALLLAKGVPQSYGAGPLLFLITLTQFNDVMQFTWGKVLGGKFIRRRIMPTVSPNKTWEGFLGGVVCTTVGAALAGPYLTPMPVAWSAGAGAMIAVAGFLGDVTISAFKRDLGVKDTSTLIPGHGGILDRVDLLIYSAPVFFHFFNFFFLSGRVLP